MNHLGQEPRVGRFFTHCDGRGDLGVSEFDSLPFAPQRFFWIHNVSEGETRANHGHRECEQLVFVQSGSVSGSTIDANDEHFEFELNVADFILVPVRHWLQLRTFSPNAVVGVFASHPFNVDEYIDSPDELNS